MGDTWRPRERRYQPNQVAAAAGAFILGVSLLAGCSSTPDDYAYCVDHNGNIINDDYCDGNGYYGGYPTFLWSSPHFYHVGYVVPVSVRTSTTFIVNTPAARSAAGLPSSGRIAGTRVSHGGFGHGSSHGNSGSHGG